MKTMKITISLLILFSSTVSWAQNPDPIHQIANSVRAYTEQKSTLTLDLLTQATSIGYREDNGSVPSEYHYDCSIIVTKSEVRVVIYKGYGRNIHYDERKALSSAAYKQFLQRLSQQDISKKTADGSEKACGAGNAVITVKNHQTVTFEGNEYTNLSIRKGALIDSFLQLMPASMQTAISAVQ